MAAIKLGHTLFSDKVQKAHMAAMKLGPTPFPDKAHMAAIRLYAVMLTTVGAVPTQNLDKLQEHI